MASPAWILTGNAGTNPATDFLGTTDNQPLIIKTLGTERIRVDASGSVGIGIVDPAALLSLANYNSIRQLVWDGASNNTQDVNCGFGINLAGAGSTLDIFMSFLYGLNIVAPTGPWPYPGFVALLTVLPNGNIGIGMTLPAFALHMPAGKTLRIEGGTNAADAADYFSFGGNGSFGIDAPGIPNGRFVVLNSGSTGIGIPNPDISTRLAVSFQAADAVSPSATGVNAQLTNDGLGPSTSAGVVGQVTNLLRTGANTQTAGGAALTTKVTAYKAKVIAMSVVKEPAILEQPCSARAGPGLACGRLPLRARSRVCSRDQFWLPEHFQSQAAVFE
jgi:hypothetical protein